tara:strand:+ start:291 stop:527 length:237 start_codon:yes stop_codon:yes gene_type:complete
MKIKKDKKKKKEDHLICKYCEHQFTEKDYQVGSKKKVSEKICIWGGLEVINIVIKRIKCTNCGKKYSTRQKSSDFLYK